LQPHLQEWLKEAKAAGCETGFLTNGLLLDENYVHETISAGVDWICVSMDGARQLYTKRSVSGPVLTKSVKTLDGLPSCERIRSLRP